MKNSIKFNQIILIALGILSLMMIAFGLYNFFSLEPKSTLSFYIITPIILLSTVVFPVLIICMGIKLKKYLTTSIKRVEFVLKIYLIFSILILATGLMTGIGLFSLSVFLVILMASIYTLISINKIYKENNLQTEFLEYGKLNQVIWQIFTGLTKFLVAVGILLFIIIFLIPFVLNTFQGKDIISINDSDLMLPKIELADNNMFIELDMIDSNMINEPSDINFIKGFLNSDSWDETYANEVFSQNEKALKIWSLAARKNEYLQPDLADPANYSMNLPVVAMSRWRQISRISVARSIWLANTGEFQQAVDEAILSVKIGDAMIKSQNSLLGYLVGMAIKNQGLDALQKIMKIANGNDVDRQKLLSDLNMYNNRNENNSIFKGEYLVAKNFFSNLVEYSSKEESDIDTNEGMLLAAYIDNNFYFKPNLTISYHVLRMKQLISNMEHACEEPQEFELPFENPILGSVWDYPKLYFTENAIGKLLTTLSVTSLNNVIKKTCELQTKHQQTYMLIESL